MPDAPDPGKLNLVTGATGLLGSHIAERLVRRGDRVRALVRPASETGFLDAIGVDRVVGDLADLDSCRTSDGGGDDGLSLGREGGRLGNLARVPGRLPRRDREPGAAPRARPGSIVSSRSVRRAPTATRPRAGRRSTRRRRSARTSGPSGTTTRSARSSANASSGDRRRTGRAPPERDPPELALRRARPDDGRPARDRLKAGKVPLIGRGDNPLSAIYAGSVADAALLAADDPKSVGEAYNITSMGSITQRDWLNLFADACGAPHPSRHAPTGSSSASASPSKPGVPDPSPTPAAHHPVCVLVDGPESLLQHGQGRGETRMEAGIRVTPRASNDRSAGIWIRRLGDRRTMTPESGIEFGRWVDHPPYNSDRRQGPPRSP